MARRPLEHELAENLKMTEFNFVPRGEILLESIYELVQRQYPNLCDDEYLCSDHCIAGMNQPEWKHVVRGVLDNLRKHAGPVNKSPQRNYWTFN